MISTGANGFNSSTESLKSALNSSKDGLKTGGAQLKPKPVPTLYKTEEGHASRDGDVLEVSAKKLDSLPYGEDISVAIKARASAQGDLAIDKPGANGLTNTSNKVGQQVPEGEEAAPKEVDPKEKQLTELRKWAQDVEKELRLQQQRLLEQYMKQSGKHVDSGDGKFLIVYIPGPGETAENDAEEKEADVPEYWNAENTSDRIVHFATQMAEIAGMDPKEFSETMLKAVGAGFDQAKEMTGELPGAAGKLNRDTHDLVFAKLSKWLEDKESMAYNRGTEKNAISTAEVPDGTKNYQQ